MSRTILLHEYRRLTTAVFTHQPTKVIIDKVDVPELKEVLELRIDTVKVPEPPRDFTIFQEMSEEELLKAGLSIWVEGTDWEMWFMPFEWRFEIAENPTSKVLYFGDGSPFEKVKWDPLIISAIFGMIAAGPIIGDFIKAAIERQHIINAAMSAGDTERFPKIREMLVNLKSSSKCVERLDRLHLELLECTASCAV